MWLYKGEEFTNPEGYYGFVYLLTYQGKSYIGRKNFYSERNIAKGKKELTAMTDKRGSKKKLVVKESDWKSYTSSHKLLKTIPAKEFTREILHLCTTKMELTYQETKLLFCQGVLESNNWWNDNIAGRYFRTK
jgi:hypothetical protein